MVSQEVVQKLHFIVQKFGEVMPKTDLMAFKQSIESYIRSGAYMSTGNQRVDNLVQAIIQSMNKEKAPPAPQVGGGRVGQWGYGGYRNYWYYPWWWNYWYYYWTPYYWWPYRSYGYVGGSSVGHGDGNGPLNVLDQAVDINQMNLSCADRQCTMTVQFTKAPLAWEQTAEPVFDITNLNGGSQA